MQNVIKVFGHLLCGVRSCNLVCTTKQSSFLPKY